MTVKLCHFSLSLVFITFLPQKRTFFLLSLCWKASFLHFYLRWDFPDKEAVDMSLLDPLQGVCLPLGYSDSLVFVSFEVSWVFLL